MDEFKRELVKIALNSLLSNTEVMKIIMKTDEGKALNPARSIACLSVDCADEIIDIMYRR